MKATGGTLGMGLRAQREERGLSLDAVAASTKIKASLLADLECGNLSRWPEGIYRRAFLRAYGDCIGLSDLAIAELIHQANASEYVRPRAVERSVADTTDTALRLTLAADAASARRRGTHVVEAAVSLGAVLVAGVAVSVFTDFTFLTAAGTIGLVCYPLMHAARGASPGLRLVQRQARPEQPRLRVPDSAPQIVEQTPRLSLESASQAEAPASLQFADS